MQMPATLSMTLSFLAEKLPVGSPYPFVGARTFSSISADLSDVLDGKNK